MSLIDDGRHYFSPQNSVVHVVNSEFLGLYGLEELPTYYQPTLDCVHFTSRLIDKVLDGTGEVELIIDDNDRSKEFGELGVKGSLLGIVGPSDLEVSLGGNTGNRSWLWDEGNFREYTVGIFLTTEGK